MTLAKKLTEGALWGVSTGVWTALPDYVDSPRTLRVVRGVGLLGTGVLYGVMAGKVVAEDDAERAAEEADEHHVVEVNESEVVMDLTQAWAALPAAWRPVIVVAGAAVGVAVTWGAFVAQQKVDDAVAARLARRGVSRPYTALGGVYAAATTALWATT